MLFSAPCVYLLLARGVCCVVRGWPEAFRFPSRRPEDFSVTCPKEAMLAFLYFLMSNRALCLASLSILSSKAVILYMLSFTAPLWLDRRELKLFRPPIAAPGFPFCSMALSLFSALNKFCLSSLSCWTMTLLSLSF